MTFRLASVLAFVAAVPAIAGAQVLPAAPTGAQTLAAPSGISVVGRGVVRVHADGVRFSATLFSANGRSAVAADADAAADAIAKALRDGGVTDAATTYFGGAYNANGPRVITGSIRKPTREGIDALVKRGNVAAAAYPGITLQNVALNFTVDDCGPAEARAQDAALADARAHAERAAHAAGMRVGPVLSINEAGAFGGSGAGACATKPDTATVTQQRLDNDVTSGDVFVSVTAAVTFALVP